MYLTAIILAAGRSARMGSPNKLLLPLGRRTILEGVVSKVCAAPVQDVIVVTGHEDRQIRDVLAGYEVRVAYNPEYASGMASSIRRGVLAARPETDAFLVCLGDMPFILPETIAYLVQSFEQQRHPAVVVPVVDERRGHPVLFDAAFRADLLQLRDDVGAQSVLAAHPEAAVFVEVGDEGILQDIDTQEIYDEARERSSLRAPDDDRPNEG